MAETPSTKPPRDNAESRELLRKKAAPRAKSSVGCFSSKG
jgi:hypothetical protein